MSAPVPDVIDRLVGIALGSPLDAIRAQRQQARDNAQASFLALFRPDDVSQMSLLERQAVAVFVAGLHGQREVTTFYTEGLGGLGGAAGLQQALETEIAHGRTTGPYGHFPAGPLSAEDLDGPAFTVSAPAALGPRLSAALAHAHLLVFHPRDAGPANLQALLDAGWSTTGIVTLSQLVAFLAFQIRVVTGLRTLAASPSDGSLP